jgi:hypothetical protein
LKVFSVAMTGVGRHPDALEICYGIRVTNAFVLHSVRKQECLHGLPPGAANLGQIAPFAMFGPNG